MIDSHCHLADEVFAPDLDTVIARARAAGIERVLVVLAAGSAQEAAQAQKLVALWPSVFVAIGVHPHQAVEHAQAPEKTADVVRAQLRATPPARAIGEIGLDYHYDFSPRDVQVSVFRSQVRLARDEGLPVVIHTREADADTLAVLREEGGGDLRGVVHCFTGDAALAKSALDLGLYISVAGILTFPKAGALRDVIRGVPIDRLLTETDSPFLTPVPHRGTRNEPMHVSRVVGALADLHSLPADEVAARTAENFVALFGP